MTRVIYETELLLHLMQMIILISLNKPSRLRASPACSFSVIISLTSFDARSTQVCIITVFQINSKSVHIQTHACLSCLCLFWFCNFQAGSVFIRLKFVQSQQRLLYEWNLILGILYWGGGKRVWFCFVQVGWRFIDSCAVTKICVSVLEMIEVMCLCKAWQKTLILQ